MRKFINRNQELDALNKQYQSQTSSLVIVYGRRRVGKTSLISEFLRSHKDTIYFLVTEESEQQNLKYFKEVVANFTNNEILKKAEVDWYQVFKTLVEYKTENRKIIVLDEFQYLGKSNSAFPSIFQKIWDTILKDDNVMVILCGSLVSLMKSQTLDYSSPLYGRRTAQIKLKQVAFKYYNQFFEKLDKDLIMFYAVTGGVPKYIETFNEYDDIFQAIKENILNPQSFLYEEPYFLLQREVKEIGSYFSLIKSIASGNRKLSEIAADLSLKQTSLTKYLKVLIDLDLIEREVPVTEKSPEKSKKGLYRITDNYIAFWFKFVYPYLSYLEKGEVDYCLSQIKKGFIQNYVSFVYEDICREKMWELSAKGMWDFHIEKIGRYWGAKVGEIDIVAIEKHKGNIILGECKYSASPKGLSVLHTLQEKAQKLVKITGSKDVYYVIFSTAGFTQGLIDEASVNQNLKLIVSLQNND